MKVAALKDTKREGFTLIEVMFVIFSAVLLLGALFTVFNWHGKIYNFESAQVQVSGSARSVMTEMQKYILQANRVLSSQSVNGNSYSSSSQQLVVQLPSYDNTGRILRDTWDYAAFYLSGTNLYETVEVNVASSRPAVANRLLSDVVSTLTITYDNADFNLVRKVTVDIQTAKQARSQTLTDHLQETTYLRNYY